MKIKRKPVIFHNLVTMTKTCPSNEWHHIAMALRNIVIERGLYINAPIFYSYTKVDERQSIYTVYVPINAEIAVEPNMSFSYIKELKIADSFVFRLADVEYPNEKEAYLLLGACAEQHACKLAYPFYNICLNVFDEMMIDIVAPIVGSTEGGDAQYTANGWDVADT